MQGTLKVLERFPDALTIFIQPESVAELERRLTARGTEKPDVVARRVDVGREEMRQSDRYQHLVINREFDRAVRDVCDLLERETN